jgi:G:T/U-mismatch repair DNA glycosylase
MLPEGMAVADQIPAALEMGVQQMEGASTVTAAHVTTQHASRGVEEAIEEAAEEHNTSDDAVTEGQG